LDYLHFRFFPTTRITQSSKSDRFPIEKSIQPTNANSFPFDSLPIPSHDKMIPRVRRLPLGRRGLATPAQLPTKDCRSITPPYPRLLETLEDVRRVLPQGSKLTLAEKILYSHLRNPEESLGGGSKIRGEKYLKLRPDRVAMQVRLLIFTMCKLTYRMHQHKWLYSNS
jgi:hypothetical protein